MAKDAFGIILQVIPIYIVTILSHKLPLEIFGVHSGAKESYDTDYKLPTDWTLTQDFTAARARSQVAALEDYALDWSIHANFAQVIRRQFLNGRCSMIVLQKSTQPVLQFRFLAAPLEIHTVEN